MKRRSLFIRIWLNDDRRISGIISDPVQQNRSPFHRETELQSLITRLPAELKERPDYLPAAGKVLAD